MGKIIKSFLGLFLLLHLTQTAWAVDSLCQRSPASIQKALRAPESRIAFKNAGGLQNRGVCWWHSRLQRAALFLAQFNSAAPKASAEEASEIIQDLIKLKNVVTIPGYSNFHDFTRAHQGLIQEALNQWQIRDGFLNQAWLRGISGKSSMRSDRMARHMDALFEAFDEQGPGLWIMLQVPGITSHAAVVIDMIQTQEGYALQIVDSNRPLVTRTLEYEYGDQWMELDDFTFVPYIGFTRDWKKIENALTDYCE